MPKTKMQVQKGFLFTRLAGEIEAGIAAGAYTAGEKLPSIRRLRESRGVSLETAYRAYVDLEARGLVETRPRAGFFVASRPRQAAAPRLSARPYGPSPVSFAAATADIIAASLDPRLIPLGASTLSPEWLPGRHLARILRGLLAAELEACLNYAPASGDPELRRAVARRSLMWGAPVDEEEVVITAGCAEAVALALAAAAPPGSPVVVESPTHFGFLQLLRESGHPVLALPTDPALGLEPSALRRVLSRHSVGACLLTPHFQNPLGALMPEERKAELVELLDRRGVALIEDDIYGELSYAEERPALMRRHDRAGNVFSCSSVSKVLAPGLRIGWCLPGRRHLAAVKRLKSAFSLAVPTLAQKAVARFLAGGAFDRHLRRLRGQLRLASSQMADALSAGFPPGTRFLAPRGGNMFWLELPTGVDAMELYARARAAGINIVPGNVFSPGSAYGHHIRLSCTRPFRADIRRAVETLGELTLELMKPPARRGGRP